MESVLVISEEPALSETLASELPGITVEMARLKDAPARMGENKQRLILIDGDLDAKLAGNANSAVIRLSRPIRLSELLYTIHERLQGKYAPSREELRLAEDFRFNPSLRLLRNTDSSVQVALTEKEAELLLCLLEAKGEIVPREMLLKRVWGYSDDIATHTLETHIYRLRGKLRQANELLDILSSDAGGYQLKAA